MADAFMGSVHEDQKGAARVLFVCTGNTCRSVLAEYIGRRFHGDGIVFESAGIRHQSTVDAANAVFTLKQTFNVDASAHVPRDVRGINLAQFDLIVAFGRDVAAVVEDLGAPPSKIEIWEVRDPYGTDLTEYDQVALEIRKRLSQLKGRTSLTKQTVIRQAD